MGVAGGNCIANAEELKRACLVLHHCLGPAGNLNSTGFYWYFEDLTVLHSALISLWESKNTQTLVDQCMIEAANVCEALFNLMDCWLDPLLFDAPLDLAIRNWARVDPNLQQWLRVADSRRIASVANLFVRYGFTPEQAEVRSLTVIYTQIGYIRCRSKERRKSGLPVSSTMSRFLQASVLRHVTSKTLCVDIACGIKGHLQWSGLGQKHAVT